VRWIWGHRFTLGAVLIVLCVTGFGLVLTREVGRNESQDRVDRARTEQVDEIVSELADVIVRLDEERVMSCAYGNEIRRNIRDFVDDLTDNPAVLEKVAIQFAERDCPAIPSPTTSTTETP
jgi:hypothetical protein